MEQVCSVCGSCKEDHHKERESFVLIICENCLKNEDIQPLLDQIFLH